jgi:1-acyl-sn-glycerol-3-phosphate acyltransferase
MGDAMIKVLRLVFFGVVVRAVILVALGLTVRHRERLPVKGPAVLAANHNSHLDTLALMSLFPLRLLPHIRPVAAADYFLKPGVMSWFALNIIGIIPVARGGAKQGANPLAACEAALDRGDILILFPEGSRGEPETLTAFKQGIGHLARARRQVPVHPVFMHGLGKALPKGSALFVPFNCIVSVGEPIYGQESYAGFTRELETRLTALAQAEHVPAWE